MPNALSLSPHEQVTLASTQVDEVRVLSGEVVVDDAKGSRIVREGKSSKVAPNGAVRLIAIRHSRIGVEGGE